MRFQRKYILLIAVAVAIFFSGLEAYKLLQKDNGSPQAGVIAQTEAAEKTPVKKNSLPKDPSKEQRAAEQNLDNKGNTSNALTWALAISLCFSVLMTLYLLRWRLNIPNAQVSIVPDELLKIIAGQNDAFANNTRALKSYVENTGGYQKDTQQQLAELQQAFSIFQNSLDSKDQEIDRHKKGYDFHVYKNFINKFIKFYIDLKREVDAPENKHASELLNEMLALFEDALSECNIEIIMPDLAKNVEDQVNIISINKKSEFTYDPKAVGKIAKVFYPAFALRTPSGIDVLREASVSVYSQEQSEAA